MHALPEDVDHVSLPELHKLLEDYINRDDNEVLELEADRKERSWRKAEGKTKREIELEQQKIEDLGEYRSGFGAFRKDLLLRLSALADTWCHRAAGSHSAGERLPLPAVDQAHWLREEPPWQQRRRSLLPRSVSRFGGPPRAILANRLDQCIAFA